MRYLASIGTGLIILAMQIVRLIERHRFCLQQGYFFSGMCMHSHSKVQSVNLYVLAYSNHLFMTVARILSKL